MPKPSAHALPLTVLSGVLLLLAGVALQGTPVDRELSLWANQHLAGGLLPHAWMLLSWSALGISGMVILTLLSVRAPQRVGAMLLALIVGGLLVHLIKHQLDWPRPAAVLQGVENFQHIGEYLRRRTMPSGHATLALALAYLMTRSPHGQGTPSPWRHLWWLFAALQAFSRVVVGAHWTSDVLVGAGMALTLTPFIWRSRAAVWLGERFDRPLARRVWAVLLVVMAVAAAVEVQPDLPRLAVQVGIVTLSLVGATAWWLSASLGSSRTAGALLQR